MKTLTLGALAVLLVTITAFGQVHRDTDGAASSGFDFLSMGIGVVIGLVIGYLVGARTRKE